MFRYYNNGQYLFKPSWGTYDMAVGSDIVSVYNGALNKNELDEMGYKPKSTTYRANYSTGEKKLQSLYQRVRGLRERNQIKENLLGILQQLKMIIRKTGFVNLKLWKFITTKKY